ncbi:hypothetical protein IWQ61_001789 [Dispira simplex]|nr:hypothetical protein IWQ61_001789 [Dispira simplex]
MAEYIPNENDSMYKERCISAEHYRRELERRYPPVCDDCQIQVQRRLSDCTRYVKSHYLLSSLMRSQHKYQFPRSLLHQVFHPLIGRVRWYLGVSLWVGQWLLVNLFYLAWLNPEAIPDQVPNPCLSNWSSMGVDSQAVILSSDSGQPCNLVHPRDSVGVSLARAAVYFIMEHSTVWWPDYVKCSIEAGFLIQVFIAGVIVIWTFDPTTLYSLYNVPGVVLYLNRYRMYQGLALSLYLASIASFHFHWFPNPLIAHCALLLIPVYNIIFLRSLHALRIQFPVTSKTGSSPLPCQPTQPQFTTSRYTQDEVLKNGDPEMSHDALAKLQLECSCPPDIPGGHTPNQDPLRAQYSAVRKRTAARSSLDEAVDWDALTLTPSRKSTASFSSKVPNHPPITPPPKPDSPVPVNTSFLVEHMFSTGELTGLEELFQKHVRVDDRWPWAMPSSLGYRIRQMVGWVQHTARSHMFNFQTSRGLVSTLVWLVTQRRGRRYLLGPLALLFRLWAVHSSFGQGFYLALLGFTVAIYIYAVLQWWRSASPDPTVKKFRNHLFFGRRTWVSERTIPSLPQGILYTLGFSGAVNALAATLRIFWALAILLFQKRGFGYGYPGSPGSFPYWPIWHTWRAMESGLLFANRHTMSGTTIAATPATPVYLPPVFDHPLLGWCASWLMSPWVGKFASWLSYPVECFLYFGVQTLPLGQVVSSTCPWCAEPTALALWFEMLALDFIWLSTLLHA